VDQFVEFAGENVDLLGQVQPAVGQGPAGAAIPRSARSSSRSRYDRAYLRYQQPASRITSGGKRNPANAEGACTGGLERRLRFIATPSPDPGDPSTQQNPLPLASFRSASPSGRTTCSGDFLHPPASSVTDQDAHSDLTGHKGSDLEYQCPSGHLDATVTAG